MLKLETLCITKGDFTLTADLHIAAGARVAIIGPSGAGKSTLLEALAGFSPLSQGRILWHDQSLETRAPGARPVAMLFQDSNLFAHLSVAENVGLGINANRRLTREEHAQVAQALSRVGLDGLHARKPAALSGGQQSRAALARALVQGRDLLLLDEPFAALGPALKVEMLDLVARLAQESGITVLMVSHDPTDAERIATEVIVVADGIAHAPQPTAQVLNDPPPALKAYLGAP